MVTDAEKAIVAQINVLGAELDKRRREAQLLNGYDEAECPLPPAIVASRLTKAYKMLMPLSEASWGSLVVGSSLDRLEVAGITDIDRVASEAAWGHWQDNQMDAEAKLLHHSALVTGRAFAMVWPGSDGRPEISLDSSEQMIVRYAEGSRRKRLQALRRWVDTDGHSYATLYTPEAIYKFRSPAADSIIGPQTEWVRRDVPGEEWPLPNPFGVVPVIEYAINRRLKPGSFGSARGEYAHCVGLLDRINLLTFLGLVVAFWMGFPLRGVIGEQILRDDEGNPLAPFDVNADSLFQIENPEAKIAEYKAADRKNLAVYAELDQLATITRTPRHYFPLEGGMSNIAADTIRANEGSLHAKVNGDYKPSLGESHEELLRLCNRVSGGPELSARAELLWRNSESRSLAEQADAATKLASIGLPWAVIAEKALDASADEIARWDTEAAGGIIGQLLRENTAPVVA